MFLEEYLRKAKITGFSLEDDNSLIVEIKECEGYSFDTVFSMAKTEEIELNQSADAKAPTMIFQGKTAIDVLLYIQMNLNDNFEELITKSRNLEFYEISSITRSYRDASDRITSAVDRLKYKNSFSELVLMNQIANMTDKVL